jgi:hypothetical protein
VSAPGVHSPALTIESRLREFLPSRDPETLKMILDGMTIAGLPE